MEGLQGKTAIVTGGSSGIGQAIAVRLGYEGVNVAVNYVGPPEGAHASTAEIERGVQACLDFPESDGPMIAVNRWRGNVTVTPANAWTMGSPEPYVFTAPTARAAPRSTKRSDPRPHPLPEGTSSADWQRPSSLVTS